MRAAMLKQMRQPQQELEREKRANAGFQAAPASTPSRKKRVRATSTSNRTRSAIDLPIAALDTVTAVIRYLFDDQLQKAIKQRRIDVLDSAKKDYVEIILVSHSLGTVVAFDVPRDCAGSYPIRRFVTMGSPLRKLHVTGCHPIDLGAITAQTVPFWRNVYDTSDLVADATGPAFPGYLVEDVFVQVGDLPLPSHDYWRNRQVLNMIAGWLR